MKRLFLFFLLPLIAFAEENPAKNLWVDAQLHWDFHRELFTSTVEIAETDHWGSIFFFTDNNFGATGQQNSYFEVTRDQALYHAKNWTGNLSVQYNDGVEQVDGIAGKLIPRTVLVGAAVNDLHWGAAIFEVQALARQEFAADLGWQLTGVWSWSIPKTPLEFLGYIDWNTNKTNHQPVSVQTEPQLQVRLKSYAIGSEWEISRNFSGAFTKKHGFSYQTWYVHPTLFLRVDF